MNVATTQKQIVWFLTTVINCPISLSTNIANNSTSVTVDPYYTVEISPSLSQILGWNGGCVLSSNSDRVTFPSLFGGTYSSYEIIYLTADFVTTQSVQDHKLPLLAYFFINFKDAGEIGVIPHVGGRLSNQQDDPQLAMQPRPRAPPSLISLSSCAYKAGISQHTFSTITFTLLDSQFEILQFPRSATTYMVLVFHPV